MHERASQPSRLTVYDLDYTLCLANTSVRFGIYLYRKGHIPTRFLLYLSTLFFFHRLGAISTIYLHQVASRSLFSHFTLQNLHSFVEDFLDKELESMLSPMLLQRFYDEQARGDYLVILSSSPDFLVREIARRLGAHEWGGVTYEEKEGKVSISLKEMMDGEGKARFFEELRQELDIPKKETAAYTDSVLDLPLLDCVEIPVAVNPDRRLRKISKERGWCIMSNFR